MRGGPSCSAQRNTGVRLATADWILWIDADMVLPPTTVSAALAIATESGADAVAVPEVSVGAGFWTASPGAGAVLLRRRPGPAQPAAAAADLLLDDGGFDPAMAGPETPTCSCGCGRPAPGPRSARTC